MKKAMLVVLSIVGLSVLQAQAHTYLSESIPTDEAVLTVAPGEIVLGFSEAVRLTAVSIREDGGAEQALEPLPGEPGERFVVGVSDLSPGDYVVSWRAVGADTHIVSGEFRFTVAAA
jgi:methionine-rich copper-binding protein CopC